MSYFAKKDVAFWLGVFCFGYYLINLGNVFLAHKPEWLLWYSSAGLLFSAIAILTRNSFLLTSMFCALFVIESIWSIGFFSLLIFHKSLYGMVEYAFSPAFPRKDFYIGLYHVLIPISLLWGVAANKINKYGWLGATLYAGILATATYIFSNPSENINCAFSAKRCVSFLSIFMSLSGPFRIIIGLAMMSLLLFIPTNYVLLWLKSKEFKIPRVYFLWGQIAAK